MKSFFRFLSIAFLLCCSACIQTNNSSSRDEEEYDASLPINGASGDFTAARAIFTNDCAACHPFHTMTEAALIAGGWVVKGDPQNSKIYNSLMGSSGTQGRKDMPDGGPALPNEDLETIAGWITNIE